MSDYIQHIKTPVTAIDNNIVKVECQQTGTIYWKHLGTGECAWTLEEIDKSTSLTHKPI